MKISAYTTVYNGIFWFTTIKQTILSALEFADEVIVVDGQSTDGTVELIKELIDMYGDKIKLITHHQTKQSYLSSAERKNVGLRACTGDYCVLMDSDEVIGEWNAPHIRIFPHHYPSAMAFTFRTLHFYRSWNRIQTTPGWYQRKIYMVANHPEIKHGPVGIDRDNFIFGDGDTPLNVFVNSIVDTDITVFHYGWCRPDHVNLMKKWRQEREWWGHHYWNNKKFPFKFDDPNELSYYDEKHPKWMKDVIREKWRWLPEFGDEHE